MSRSICLVNLHAWPVLIGRSGPGFRFGGEEVQHSLMARSLARQGWNVTLVVGDYGQETEAFIDGIRVLKAHGEHEDRRRGLRYLYRRWFKLDRALTRADADVYYISCADSAVGQVAMFCRRRNRRLVFRVASDADCDPARLPVNRRRHRWMYRYGLATADAVLVQTERQRIMLNDGFDRGSVMARMLVDIPGDILPRETRATDILWVANLREMKRPEWVPVLAQGLPEYGITMVGGPDPDEIPLFERTRQDLMSLPNTRFLGPVSFQCSGELYRNARLFINTSRLEGFPNSYLQAWVQGTPVVGTFDPDGVITRHGLGIAVSTETEMAQAVRFLLGNADEWREASRRCRAFMIERFAEVVVLAPYLEAFGGAVGRELGVKAPSWDRDVGTT